MQIGQTVFVVVNGGQLKRGLVIDIKGDTIIVSGPDERQIAESKGRKPIGVGFSRASIEKAKALAANLGNERIENNG